MCYVKKLEAPKKMRGPGAAAPVALAHPSARACCLKKSGVHTVTTIHTLKSTRPHAWWQLLELPSEGLRTLEKWSQACVSVASDLLGFRISDRRAFAFRGGGFGPRRNRPWRMALYRWCHAIAPFPTDQQGTRKSDLKKGISAEKKRHEDK